MIPKPYYSETGIEIYLGDCRDILPHLPKVDLVLTDPPYGLGRKLHDGGTWGTDPKYDAMLKWDVLLNVTDLLNILSCGDKQIVWGGNNYSLPPSRCWLSWLKNNSVPTMADFELAWTNFDRPARCFKGKIHPDGINQHPTQKPLYLMKWCLSMAAGTALDPFMGSGTTLVAAKQLGRKAIGIEIEKKYCDIAIDRLRQEVLPLNQPEYKQEQEGLL